MPATRHRALAFDSRATPAMSDHHDSASVIIREAVPADAPALSAIAREAKAVWGYDPAWINIWGPQLTIDVAAIEDMDMRVADVDGDPAGFVALAHDGPRMEIAHLWVRPRFARRGIGQRLLRSALAIARQRGARSVRVESDPHAERFYRNAGAVRVGAIPAPMPGAPERVLPVLELMTE